MKWRKLGQVFCPGNQYPWMVSHAAVPFMDYTEDGHLKIYFSSRDINNISSTCYLILDNISFNVLEIANQSVLTQGRVGTFDDCGSMGSCLVNYLKQKYMYYIGWNRTDIVPFRNSIGLAISMDNGKTFSKYSNGPIIDRNTVDNYFTASCCVLYDKEIFKMWYLSSTGWILLNKTPFHRYHIRYAQSDDGVHWDRKGQVAIDYKDEHEYAISVPRVIKDKNLYRMWYSYRGSTNNNTYRIGYAESSDGIDWVRKDEKVGIDVSNEGWDSEMICYPFIFDHKGDRFMLYNGNGYGKTGFGIAILEQD